MLESEALFRLSAYMQLSKACVKDGKNNAFIFDLSEETISSLFTPFAYRTMINPLRVDELNCGDAADTAT